MNSFLHRVWAIVVCAFTHPIGQDCSISYDGKITCQHGACSLKKDNA